MNLTTETQLAELFGITPAKAAEYRKKKGWPHVRFGRFDIRYTDAQVQQIVNLHTSAATRKSGVTGQTARSAARSA